ncbi:MAG: hypothetical protein ACLTSL_00195 [Odoribacter splanchnicus]
MNKIILFFIYILMALFVILACQNEPEFPDPKFDSNETRTYDVRRDTAEVVHLKCFIDVPNGIDQIEIIEGHTYEVLEVLEQYRGLKQVEFDYPVDISDIVQDTTLAFIVKVRDVKLRSYNKPFVINIKKFSIPEIILMGSSVVSTDVNMYKISASLTTGMIPIAKVSLTVDNKVQEIPEINSDTTDYQLEYIVNVRSAGTYNVRIILEDINGRRTSKDLKIIKVRQMEKPVKILCGGNQQYEFLLEYEGSKLRKIDMIGHYKFELIYENVAGKEVVTNIRQNGYGLENPDNYTYIYKYDEKGRLQQLIEQWGSMHNSLIDVCLYDDENTRMLGFIAGASKVTDIAYETVDNTTIMSEMWISAFAATREGTRVKNVDFQTVKIPTYFDQLPYPLLLPYKAYIAFQDVFLSPYVHLKTVGYIDNTAIVYTYSYSNDEKGRLAELTRIEPQERGSLTYYYKFIYKDSL